jgi:hypothetical protein
MWAVWNATKEVVFRPIDKNVFIVQTFCLGTGLGSWRRGCGSSVSVR